METICFHHNDLDGKLAGAIVLNHYPEAKLISIDYGDTFTQYDLSKTRVIVVDFSFPDMMALKNACRELIWIDHHKTVFDTQRQAWISPSIPGYRSLDFAGCMLTYAYFAKPRISLDYIHLGIVEGWIPLAVKYVNDYDLWKFKQGGDVDAFCAAAYLIWQQPKDILNEIFFSNANGDYNEISYDTIKDYISKGKLLLQAANNRIVYLASREKPQIITHQDIKVKLLFLNATCDISKLGSYVNTELKCDIAAIYEIVDGNIRVHLRSQILNVEPIARSFGGGGHPGAASYSINDSVESTRDKLQAAIFRLLHLLKR